MLWLLLATLSHADPPAPAPAPAPALPTGPDTTALDWIRFFSTERHLNFVLADADALQKTKITLLAGDPHPTPDQAWDTFQAAMATAGYVVVVVGQHAEVVKTADAARAPVPVR
jgi:hypothetical protein